MPKTHRSATRKKTQGWDDYSQILLDAIKFLGSEKGNLLLSKEKELVFSQHTKHGDLRTKIKIGKSITGIEVKEKYVRVLDRDIDSSQQRFSLVIPLLIEDGETIGVINVESPDNSIFSNIDEALIKEIAQQAATIIKSTRREPKDEGSPT